VYVVVVRAEPRDRIGTVIDGRYRIDRLIGRGAMAEVFRATSLADHAAVAVKILTQQVSANPNAQQRFAREARVQAMIRHHNVAALLGSGLTPEREPYLVLELLRGRSLRSVIKAEGLVSPRRAVSYAWQALQGLAAVHSAGVLHRDLKPANIMLEPVAQGGERIILIDFGFASLDGGAKLTLQGTVVGSLTYMAPERLRGEPPDERADLYSIGIVLFELLKGAPPYAAEDDLDLIEQHLEGPLPRLYDLAAGITMPLVEVVRVALAKHPSDRFASALAMAHALEKAAPSLAS
jgi:eukaryotic-like serine/threonine-protein kinase